MKERTVPFCQAIYTVTPNEMLLQVSLMHLYNTISSLKDNIFITDSVQRVSLKNKQTAYQRVIKIRMVYK